VACAAHRALIFPAPRPQLPTAAPGLRILAPADHSASALCAVAADVDAPLVVFFHGNAEQIADYARPALDMARRGIGFCAVEYPGYGALSAMHPSEVGVYQSATVALDWVERELHVDRSRITLAGWSLGSGVAVEMAVRHRGSRVLLLSPYTSLTHVAQRIAVILPMRLIMSDHFDSLDKMQNILVPVLVVHGRRDHLIPAEMGSALAHRAPNGRYVELQQRAHNDVISVLFNEASSTVEPDYDAARVAVERFIRAR
jgi:fermentation-respiration switch protein FrsA (DUF1100 family)